MEKFLQAEMYCCTILLNQFNKMSYSNKVVVVIFVVVVCSAVSQWQCCSHSLCGPTRLAEDPVCCSVSG